MIELNGIQYTVKKPIENTTDMLNTINTYCVQHDVRNSKDEVVYIEANMANPLYIILWALGYLVTIIQNLIYSVGKGFDLASCNDTQLLNLADIAGVKRGAPSVTTFSALVTALTAQEEGYDQETGTCTITSDDVITYNNVVYKPAIYPNLVLQAGDTRVITFVAQTAGSYNISENTITAFDSPITNLKSIYQYASAPGQAQETIANLRLRMQRRSSSGTSIDAAMDSIRSLPGVTLCNIFYNAAIEDAAYVGSDNIRVPARWALLLVQGYNENIAKTFFNYITCPTVEIVNGEPDLSNLQGHTERLLAIQYYTTHANQQIPVMLIKPKQENIYIRLYIRQAITSNLELQIKAKIASLAADITAGQSITSAMILAKVQEFSYLELLGATVSSDAQGDFSFQSTQAPDTLWVFNVDNISIIMQDTL